MKKGSRRGRILPRADINVTPFIDILLVLLVIFMTITPTTPVGLAADAGKEAGVDRLGLMTDAISAQ